MGISKLEDFLFFGHVLIYTFHTLDYLLDMRSFVMVILSCW